MATRLRRPPEMRYISRFEAAGSKSWRVQYVRGRDKALQVYFSDSAYGGAEAALDAAKRFRDDLLAEQAPKPPRVKNPVARRNLRHQEKTEEMVGISLKRDCRPTGTVFYAWTARARIQGMNVERSWSVLKHGYHGGYRKAAQYREKLTGQPAVYEPPAPSDELRRWAESYDLSLEYGQSSKS